MNLAKLIIGRVEIVFLNLNNNKSTIGDFVLWNYGFKSKI